MSPEFANNRNKYIPGILRDLPVFYYDPMNIWVVSKHEDVKNGFFDSATYSSSAWGLLPPPDDIAPRVQDMNTDVRINTMDPPDHAKLRVPVQQAFLPGGLTSVEASARRIANELIDRFIDKGECDLLQEFCYPFPLHVILELLGVPKDRAEDYHRWAASFFMLFTPKLPDGSTDPEHYKSMPADFLRANWSNIAEANDYFRPIVEDLDEHPGKNVLSALLQLREPDGSRTLTLSTNVRNALDFVSAGHDTTATAVAHLIHFTETVAGLKDTLRKDPALIPAAIDETLRMRGSADGLFRRNLEEVEIRGVRIPRGSIVYLYIQAANLDPDEFPNPLEFDLGRQNSKTMMSFGYGRHTCVGQHLARIELRVAFEELYRRIPSLRLAEGFTQMTYTPMVMNVTPQSLPVVWEV